MMRDSCVLTLVVFLAGCSGPYSGQKTAAKESAPRSVQTLVLARTAIPEVISANGELFAEESATLSTKVPGRVLKIAVDLGSTVRAGDLIAELEKDDYQFRVRQAEALVEQTRARLGIPGQSDDRVTAERTAMVQQAQAALNEADVVYRTTDGLAREGIISKVDLEKALMRRQGAEAAYQSALSEVMLLRNQLAERRAQLDLARQQLKDSTVLAPFEGAITRRQASQGEYLGVNAPVVTLVRQHPLRVRLEVPERQAARVRRGQRIDLRLEGSAMGRSGRVVRMSPAIEAQNRSLLIEGEIPNQDGVLRPGSFVEGSIVVDPDAAGIAVPRAAVASFAGIERAYVVVDGVLEDRVLKTGRRLSGDRIEVLEGLSAGDRLVVKAGDRMAKGQRVKAE